MRLTALPNSLSLDLMQLSIADIISRSWSVRMIFVLRNAWWSKREGIASVMNQSNIDLDWFGRRASMMGRFLFDDVFPVPRICGRFSAFVPNTTSNPKTDGNNWWYRRAWSVTQHTARMNSPLPRSNPSMTDLMNFADESSILCNSDWDLITSLRLFLFLTLTFSRATS